MAADRWIFVDDRPEGHRDELRFEPGADVTVDRIDLTVVQFSAATPSIARISLGRGDLEKLGRVIFESLGLALPHSSTAGAILNKAVAKFRVLDDRMLELSEAEERARKALDELQETLTP